ncbi:MAG: glucosamine-6-phosphate deaminase [Sphingobacteriales bacterium]|nr:glucosamine-6-phosphate deaminase [Sphingobacteriales bacterium]
MRSLRWTVGGTPEIMGLQVADRLRQCLEGVKAPLICPASGTTPAPLYHELVRRHRAGTMDLGAWNFVGLDEWIGLNGSDEGSCRWWLDKDLFRPLGVGEDRICFFDGRAADLAGECATTERFIAERGGMNVVILGIGTNGHIAMNEPGTDVAARSRVVTLHPTTQSVGQKYFTRQTVLEKGITLGLGTIREARHIFLLATGEHKASIIQQALEGPVSADVPASLLRDHPGLEVWLDEAAAGKLGG